MLTQLRFEDIAEIRDLNHSIGALITVEWEKEENYLGDFTPCDIFWDIDALIIHHPNGKDEELLFNSNNVTHKVFAATIYRTLKEKDICTRLSSM